MGKVTVNGGSSVAGDAPSRPSVLQLRRQLREAQAGNAGYLDAPQPTASGTREQVAALTEQMQVLIRLVLGA